MWQKYIHFDNALVCISENNLQFAPIHFFKYHVVINDFDGTD